MMLLKKSFVLIALTIVFKYAVAQESAVSDIVKKAITQITFHGVGMDHLFNMPNGERNIVGSVIISTNKEGKVNNVAFTNTSPIADSVMRYQPLKSLIKADKGKYFLSHKNTVYIIPVWISILGELTLNQTPEFNKSIDGLIPLPIAGSKNKKRIVLPILRIQAGMPKP